MNENGFAVVPVMWILFAVSALSLSALTLARRAREEARGRLQDVHTLILVAGAAGTAVQNNFQQTLFTREMNDGAVAVERVWKKKDEEALLKCMANWGGVTRSVEIDWKKSGGRWRAVMWKER